MGLARLVFFALRQRASDRTSKQDRSSLQGIIPRLPLAVQSTSTVEQDVASAKQPERYLCLERYVERVPRPIRQIGIKLDCPFNSLHSHVQVVVSTTFSVGIDRR